MDLPVPSRPPKLAGSRCATQLASRLLNSPEARAPNTLPSMTGDLGSDSRGFLPAQLPDSSLGAGCGAEPGLRGGVRRPCWLLCPLLWPRVPNQGLLFLLAHRLSENLGELCHQGVACL